MPGPQDVLLLIEVSDTTYATDRTFKLPLYAQEGIPEVWIVNRAGERIEVYRDPRDGAYQSVTMVGRGDSVTPRAFPDLNVEVNDILG